MAFQRATKTQVKLRLALFGPSGAGKTYTALRIASGLGGRIAVIDSERNSANRYADRFTFDADSPGDKTIESYIKSINEAAKAGYEVLIVDSLSHAWKELLQEVERIARSKYKGNTWSAWSDGTPMQQKLIDAILAYPGHIMVTMRSKTEWIQEEASNGKSKPVRVGLAPEQGKGIEYEFDILLELTADHLGTVIKDRTGKFQDKTIDKPGEDFGIALSNWLKDGAEPAQPPQTPPIDPDYAQAKREILDELEAIYMGQGKTAAQWDAQLVKLMDKTPDELEIVLGDWAKRAAAKSEAKQEAAA